MEDCSLPFFLFFSVSTAWANSQTSFSVNRALEHIHQLAGVIGPRAAGTTGDEKGVEYISNQFRSYGYEVKHQSFTFPYFEDRGSSLTARGNGEIDVQSHALIYSPSGQVREEMHYTLTRWPLALSIPRKVDHDGAI